MTIGNTRRRKSYYGSRDLKGVDDAKNDYGILRFNMASTFITMIFIGGIVGWIISKHIPILPKWIAAIVGASLMGYTTNERSRKGDLLRYIGFCLTESLAVILHASKDVHLGTKFGALLNRILYIARRLDRKFHIVPKLQIYLTILIDQLTVLINRYTYPNISFPIYYLKSVLY